MNSFLKPVFWFVTICVIIIIVAVPLKVKAEIIDRVVAIVNEDIITLSDLESKGAPIFQKIRLTTPGPELKKTLERARQDTLTQLIEQAIIIQRGKELNLSVNDAEVDAAIERILRTNKISIENFRRQLERIGSTEKQYRTNLKDNLLQSKTVDREVRSKIVITDEMVEKHYHENYLTSELPEGYRILQIGMTWGKNGAKTKEKALERANEIRKMALNGSDFMTLARTHSDLPSARDGGDIGVFKKEEMAPHMLETVVEMQPGGISDILNIPSGCFQFFKLISLKNENKTVRAELDWVKMEIKEQLFQTIMKTQYEAWLEQLREKTFIKKRL